MNKSNLLLASILAILFTSILIIFSPTSKKSTTPDWSSYPTIVPTINTKKSNIIDISNQITVSETIPGWNQINGNDYSLSFPKDWTTRVTESDDKLYGQGVFMQSSDNHVILHISPTSGEFDYFLEPSETPITIFVGNKKYFTNETSFQPQGVGNFILVTDIISEKSKINYRILYQNKSTTSADSYFKYKPTIIQILSTFKFTP